MIDEAILNDLQISGFPKLIITDEVLMDIERIKNKKNVAVQQKKEDRGSSKANLSA